MVKQHTVWRMHAHRRNGTHWHVGHRRYVELHGGNDPVVEVEVRLAADGDPAATHWGWLASEADEPSMIWPNLPCYQVCFPYGPEAEERAGKGRTVRLTVTEVGR